MKTFKDFFSLTNPPVTEIKLNKIELEIGFSIPNSLRQLYMLSDGCRVDQMRDTIHVIYYNNEPLGHLMSIYSVESIITILYSFKSAEEAGLGDYGTNRFIPFSDIGRAFLCIGHTGEDLGKIFWMDTGNPINETDFETFKLADSLQEFFDGLRPSE
ncbi:MAG: SMI1/KNR4 family protein [Bacteroidetes bacterium]|nr:SMI1/KNR4 family protein [Bacteroidota bacterium]